MERTEVAALPPEMSASQHRFPLQYRHVHTNVYSVMSCERTRSGLGPDR